MTDKLKNSIRSLQPVSLEEMDAVKLMNRTDTKFAFNSRLLPAILNLASENYKILEIKNTRTPSYKTVYFDTNEHKLFLDHHNEKGYRYKIRIRNYVESGLFFLEVKKKVKGRTDKKRIQVDNIHENLTNEQLEFIAEASNEKIAMVPLLWNEFNRITLVNKLQPERITIDFNLSFSANLKSYPLPNIAIAEVKQERVNLHSPFVVILKKLGIRETALSKYCIGSLLCYDGLKYNNFKEKLLIIDKINNAA